MFITKTNKSKFYQIIYTVKNKRTSVSTKTIDLEEAKLFMKEFKRELRNGKRKQKLVNRDSNIYESSIPVLPALPNSIRLSQFLKEYLEYITPIKSQNYVRSVDLSFRMLMDFCGNVPLRNLELRILDKFIVETYSRAKYAALMYYQTLKAGFSKAIIWGYLQDNPLKKIKFPKIPKSLPIFITVPELERIIEKTQADYLKDVFFTAFYTGMRLSEVINLRWSWVDFNKNIITVKCTENFTPKGKKERKIPMTAALHQKLLKKYSKNKYNGADHFVFYRRDYILHTPDHVSKKFKDAVLDSGINNRVHFHTLRHSFASLLVQKGVSLYVVKELLGHEDFATTQIYAHLQTQNLMDAVKLL